MSREGRPRDWTDTPWRDAETLDRLYNGKGLTQQEIAERFDVTQTTIRKWMDRLGVGTLGPGGHSPEDPWRDSELMYEEYVEKRQTIATIADKYGVSDRTISSWIDKHGFEKRSNRVEWASFYTDTNGYERWAAYHDGVVESALVHRLLAVAEYGFDAVKDKDVHHGPVEIRWANWHDNVHPIDPREHRSLHRISKADSRFQGEG